MMKVSGEGMWKDDDNDKRKEQIFHISVFFSLHIQIYNKHFFVKILNFSSSLSL